MKKRLFQVLFLFLLVLMLPFSQNIGERQVWAAEEGAQLPGYENPTYTFNAIDGSKVSTQSTDGKTVVLVFGGTDCPRTRKTIQNIAGSDLVTTKTNRIIFAECSGAPQYGDEWVMGVAEFADKYGSGTDQIAYCYDEGQSIMGAMSNYLSIFGMNSTSGSFPVIVLIDKNNRLR